MRFNSRLPKGCEVITDQNWRDFSRPVKGPNGTSDTGYVNRDWSAQPLGSLPGSRRMPQHLIIPRDEWRERIEERERTGKTLYARLRKSKVRWLNQSPSWYCWCYAVVHGCMAQLIIQNDPHRVLVPESVAGPIKNYRKQGGWGSQALAYIVKNGVADTSVWPWESHSQANSPRYFNGSRENAALTKVEEFWDLETEEEKMSCLLRDIVVPCGYSNMGHEMCSIDPIIKDGQFGSLDLDSYAQNGKFNTKARVGRQNFVGNDMVAIRTITPNSLEAA